MREHPVPQDITNYQFHIIGNMTIKQFAELAVGVIFGLIIYATNLPQFLKWPLIALALGTGAMAAFVPFEERMLDHWLMTFVRVLYRPTKYFWKREPHIPDPFLYKPSDRSKNQEVEVDLSPTRRQRVLEYFSSLPEEGVQDQFDQYQNMRIAELMTVFSNVPGATAAPHGKVKPSLEVKVRSLSAPANLEPQATASAAPNTVDQTATETVVPDQYRPEVTTQDDAETNTVVSAQTFQNADVTLTEVTYQENTTAPLDAAAATYNTTLPFPTAPSTPNKPVGMILGPQNELITNAIVEISDQSGHVARAVKSNTLGQFFITTPLEDGEYLVNVEHPNYAFSPVSIILSGSPVPPIEVRALAS